MADGAGEIAYLLLAGRGYLKDNRLPPVGFTESGEHFVPESASIGVADDVDFHAGASGADAIHYRIDVEPELRPFTVRAELLYQSVRPAFVDVLSAQSERVSDYRDYYAQVPPLPEVMAAVEEVASFETLFRNGFEPL
jgi:hypothetical protein